MMLAAAETSHVFRDLSWIIPVLPFGAFLLILFFGKRTPGKGAPIGILAAAAGFALSVPVFIESIAAHGEVVEKSFRWIALLDTEIELGMRVDALAAMMFVVVTFVSMLVQLYSVGYMKGEPRYTWYFAAINLFTGSMLTLVIANNLVQMLVGWEGVGVCSYMLIGHYFEQKENSNAANKAFITTRAGDLGFVVGIFVLFIAAGTFNIGGIAEKVENHEISTGLLTVGAVLLFFGAMGKSAQFPLHVWLPDAMAGPTPVSALIHAATMVAAGVYMVARIYGVFHESPGAMAEIAIIASITMLLAALMACVARDIKQVLAYSTVSQLAYMMAGLAVGGYTAGIFHLWTHAFFKALLFLGAGSVIHAVHTNDMFEMGGLRKFMPITFGTFIIGSAALAGIPPLAGFWSKDEILVSALDARHWIVFGAALTTAFLTAFYMTRACSLTFFGAYRRMPIAGAATDDDHGHGSHGLPHESPPLMSVPLMILAFMSIAAGLVGTPLMPLFADWIHFEGAHHGKFTMWLAVLSVGLALAGIAIGWRLYSRATLGFGVVDPLAKFGPLYRAAVRRFYIDDIYMKGIVRPVQYTLARIVYAFDQGVVDKIVRGAGAATVLAGRAARAVDESGVDGIVNGAGVLTDRLGGVLRRIQGGNVQRYAAGLFAGVVLLVLVFFR